MNKLKEINILKKEANKAFLKNELSEVFTKKQLENIDIDTLRKLYSENYKAINSYNSDIQADIKELKRLRKELIDHSFYDIEEINAMDDDQIYTAYDDHYEFLDKCNTIKNFLKQNA